MREEHVPLLDPCCLCGKPAKSHRVYHVPSGNPCTKCGLPDSHHRQRSTALPKYDLKRSEPIYIGIDGEGQGRNPHRYVLLAASDESAKKRWHVENFQGLSTVQCLDFLLSLPKTGKCFAYAFGYDLTKILQDLGDRELWLLFHPEVRQRPKKQSMMGPVPVPWGNYYLNLQGSKFTVVEKYSTRARRRTVIWDVFRFFAVKFVKACADWKIGTPEERERMQLMKDKRSEFDKESPEGVRAYCFSECSWMAALAHKLTKAHNDAGLKLTSYYGAGSTAGAMLKKMGIRDKIKDPPKKMLEPIASAFFGGRFENSCIGEVSGIVYNLDISSAYPYQTAFLPCLEHAHWEHVTRLSQVEKALHALVRYRLHDPPKNLCWGPFPFRESDGSISFPATSGGGWVWKNEFMTGLALFPHVQFVEGWILHSCCNCQPFSQIPKWYRERLRIGKEGPGLVLKLGCNSCYGKVAQSVGSAPFQCWAWAGMITSGCRAQLMQLAGLHKEWANILMTATDGIYTREDIVPPIPKDTGTFNCVDEFGKPANKPLGGWEKKAIPQGVFIARPGIYFPMNPTEKEIEKMRARGLGRKTLFDSWPKIVASWNEHRDTCEIAVTNVSRFRGAKTSIRRRQDGVINRSLAYGEWDSIPVNMSFNPMPKRECILPDNTLKMRAFPKNMTSVPYQKGLISPDAIALSKFEQEILEQPDVDLHESGVGIENFQS